MEEKISFPSSRVTTFPWGYQGTASRAPVVVLVWDGAQDYEAGRRMTEQLPQMV